MQTSSKKRLQPSYAGLMIFAIVAVIGFAYVKWLPYYGKAFYAQSHHAIGHSILSGQSISVPPATWSAAVNYAVDYGKTIWEALVLGLLLGSGIKVLLPSQWMGKALGRMGFKNVALGSLFGIPCLMCTCCAAPVAVPHANGWQ